MKKKPNILKLEPHEYLIDTDHPLAKDINIFIKGKPIHNVTAIVRDTRHHDT